jgi:hypothetical protein
VLHLGAIPVARQVAGQGAVKLGVLEPLAVVDDAERQVLMATLRPRSPPLAHAR